MFYTATSLSEWNFFMFKWFGSGFGLISHIIMMYFGMCFRKIDYVVVHPEDEEIKSTDDLEANKTGSIETKQDKKSSDKGGSKKKADKSNKFVEEEEEEEVVYERGAIIGRTKEGIPIRVMWPMFSK